ncbi:uncharacterized protein BKA55DRAFT_591837 [Fusarium redolens]|uniref:Uncharacterized protein n=1 Tax=Fusarium redolens TaxID=48865 RepID=A0A9P9HJX2_FUSRE|nr:uncharacterized protein BKA55DRAFT_591837 [Fusarium redolens]KAH7259038.1 hypothetical protein BKA55DRAFT_591837 [Fusarium redolens]
MNSNSPYPRVTYIPTPKTQRASGSLQQVLASPVRQAPAPPAMADIRVARLRGLSTILNNSTSPKEATEIFTSELQVMAKNTTDVLSILAQIIQHYKDGTRIHRQAHRERLIVYDGHWTTYFRKVAADAQWLTNQWGGKPWLPADIRTAAESLFGNSEPSTYVHMLVEITKAAQAKGMGLHTLRVAMRKDALQYLTRQMVNSVIKEINGRSVKEASKALKNSVQDKTVIDLANSDEAGMGRSNETRPITKDPSNKLPLANREHTLPESLDYRASQDNSAPKQSQPSPLTKDAKATTPPTSKKRTFEQMNGAEISSYTKYETLVSNLKPDKIAQLRAQAIKNLERAESDKARCDCALAYLNEKEDQMKQIRDQGKTLIDEMSSGIKEQGNQGVLAGVLASTGTAYFNGINRLLDSLLQSLSGSQDGRTVRDLQAQRAEAVDKADKEKKQVQALNHIEKARSIHENYKEAKGYRQKILDLLSETDERAMDLEKACIVAFSHAEQEDWASVLAPEDE